jgi:hypothetical protein
MPTRTFLFQPRFAPKVKAGEKLQTVRPFRKRRPEPGDPLSLREWTSKPYRSKQRELRQAVIKRVAAIHLDLFGILSIDGEWLTASRQDVFAHDDGFSNADEMREWFGKTHGLPFNGMVIYWR